MPAHAADEERLGEHPLGDVLGGLAGLQDAQALGPDHRLDRPPGRERRVDLRPHAQPARTLDDAVGAGRDDAPGDDVEFAEEVGGKLRARAEIELLRRADLLDPPGLHEADAIGHGQRLLLVVGDIEDGDAEALVQLLDLELHVVAQLLVERAERLVHEDDRRPVDQAARERDALLLAARELLRKPARDVRQLHDVEDAAHLLGRLRCRHAAHVQREGDVLLDRQVREQRVVLEHHADVALVRRLVGRQLAADPDLACRRLDQPGDDHQQRGLARARGPEQRQELALGKVEARIGERQHRAIALADAADRSLVASPADTPAPGAPAEIRSGARR